MNKEFLAVMIKYDDVTQNKILELSSRLTEQGFVGMHTRDIQYHISLGTFSTDMKEEILLRVEAFEFKKFEVNINHWGILGRNNIVLCPKVNNELLGIQACFNSNYQDGYDWTPHTTLFMEDEEIIYKAVPIVNRNFVPIVGKVDTLSLYKFWPKELIYEKIGE